jgi:hypothetical protein
MIPTERNHPPKRRKNFPPFWGMLRPRGSWATCGAPNRPSTEKGAKFAPFSGHHATARQLGDLRQAKKRTICPLLQREPKCAPTRTSRYPPKTRTICPCFTAGTEVRPTGVKLTPVRPHSRFALCPDNGVNLTPLSAGTKVRSTHCVSCATMATRKSGKIYHLFGLRIARAAAERYNGSVCCAAAYALSCPLRSLRLCCSRVLTPRSQSSITDVS